MSSEKVVYKNKLDLPRLGKSEFSTQLVNRKLFEKSKEILKDVDSYEEFYKIWILISDKIKQQVSTNPLGVHLPYYIGDLKVNYLPYKFQVIDDVASQKVGIPIPELYLNSKGKRASIVWERKGARRFNRVLDLYAFDVLQASFRDVVRRALEKTPELFRVGRLKSNNLIRE